MLVFRQLFDATSSTCSYLLGERDGGAALLIDPVHEQLPRGLSLVQELGLRLLATLDTHVHADGLIYPGARLARRHRHPHGRGEPLQPVSGRCDVNRGDFTGCRNHLGLPG